MSKRYFSAVVCCLLLAGCASIVIDQPQGSQPAAPRPVPVNFRIEITKSVYGRTANAGGIPIDLTKFTSSIKAGTQNTEILTGTVSFQPGTYTLTVAGTYDQWNGQPSPISTMSSFTVTAKPTVGLTVSPTSIVLPRNGLSPPLNFSVTRTDSTDQVDITASGLPANVTLPMVSIPGTDTSHVANLTATSTANGTANATFTASLPGADNAQQSANIQVVPQSGLISWVAPPFLTTGPPMPTSPDGRFRVTANRIDAQRVWTLHIVATSGTPPKSLDVTTAQWGGTGGSNLAGLAFCPNTTMTTSALVISDENENPDVSMHPNNVTFRLKVIRFDGGTPRQQGTIDGIYFLDPVHEPKLGFSPDCSIVGGWSTDSTGSSTRIVSLMDIFNGNTAKFQFTDTATQPSTSLVAISGANLNVTTPAGPVQTQPVP